MSWYSGTGAGGQHRNKHQNSCRLRHVPTGLVAKSEERSREASYAKALAELTQRVNAQLRSATLASEARDRREQVGSGQRGDKIRTYRLQDDTVVDHSTGARTTWREFQRTGEVA